MRLINADCIEAMRALEPDSIDAIVCDPPYGIGFMGKEWDAFKPEIVQRQAEVDRRKATTPTSERYPERVARQSQGGGVSIRYDESTSGNQRFQGWMTLWAAECLRILKPGAHLLAFGGTRTYHRLACAVEDAGFEIRDSLLWLYGSGFPKSLDVSKAIDKAAGVEREVVETIPDRWAGEGGVYRRSEQAPAETVNLTAPATPEARQWQGWGTALKPAHEPIVVARKPLAGTVAANVLEHGTGALNVDGCRVEPSSEYGRSAANSEGRRPKGEGATFPTPERDADYASPLGRWPSNVILSPEAAAELDEQSGELTSGANPTRRGSDKFRNAYGDFEGQRECEPARGVDIGGASRFFYCAKASRAERNAGLDSKIGVCRCPRHQADIPHLKGIDAATAEGESDSSTTGSGSRSEDRSPRATKSTTETATKPTTGSKTSSSSPRPSTSESTHLTSDAPATDGSDAALSAASGNRQTPSTSTSTSRAGFSTDAADPATSHESLPTSNGADPLCPDCGGVISGALRNSHPT